MKEDYLSMSKKALAIGAWEEAQKLQARTVEENPSPEALEESAWTLW